MVDVVLINGPPGVGKAAVATLLAARTSGAVCVCAAFCAPRPADARAHLGPGSTQRAAGALAAAYLAFGAPRVIVDDIFLDRVGRHP